MARLGALAVLAAVSSVLPLSWISVRLAAQCGEAFVGPKRPSKLTAPVQAQRDSNSRLAMNIEEVLSRMQAHPEDVEAQRQGLVRMQSLTNLFTNNAAVAELGQQGIFEVLIAAMTLDQGIAAGASELLSAILRTSPELRPSAASAGAAAALVEVLGKWRDHGAGAALGLLALGSAEVQQEALGLGALEVLAAARETVEPEYLRSSFAFFSFAVAQADAEAFLQLTQQAGWVEDLEEVEEDIDDLPTLLATEVEELVKLARQVKETGHPPAADG